jgi:hypothetical protein
VLGALSYIGRNDLVLRAEGLTDDQLLRIGKKTTDIRSSSGERDRLRAIGMAAVSVLEGLQFPRVPEDTMATSSTARYRALRRSGPKLRTCRPAVRLEVAVGSSGGSR